MRPLTLPRVAVSVLFLASLAAAPALCQVAPPPPLVLPTPLSLPEAVALALRHQPQQYLARTQVTQAQGQKLQAQSQYFPVLTPSYQYQNTSNALYGVGSGAATTFTTTGTGTGGTGTTGTGVGTTGTGTTGTATSPGTTGTTTVVQSSANEVSIVRGGGLSVSLSQTLFDIGQREAANTEARRAVDAAEENSRVTRQAVILNVTQDYYQLLLNQDLVKVAQAQVARFQQTVEVTQAQIDAGTTAAKDIFQAKSDSGERAGHAAQQSKCRANRVGGAEERHRH